MSRPRDPFARQIVTKRSKRQAETENVWLAAARICTAVEESGLRYVAVEMEPRQWKMLSENTHCLFVPRGNGDVGVELRGVRFYPVKP